jgi:NADH dehydrogenase
LSEGEIVPTTRLILRKPKERPGVAGEVNAIDLMAQTVTSKLMDMTTVTAVRQSHRGGRCAAVLLR